MTPEATGGSAGFDVLRHRDADDCQPKKQAEGPARGLISQRRPQTDLILTFRGKPPKHNDRQTNDQITRTTSLEKNGEEDDALNKQQQQMRDLWLGPIDVGWFDDLK